MIKNFFKTKHFSEVFGSHVVLLHWTESKWMQYNHSSDIKDLFSMHNINALGV